MVFSKQLMERETDEFVNNCKAQVENTEKQDDNVKDKGTPNCELDDITIDVDESIKKPREVSKHQADSMMIPFGRPSLTGSTLADAIATQIEKEGVFVKKNTKSKRLTRRQKLMKRLNIAPAEENIPTDYLKDKFLEEKAFPHLFPSVEGGYVSTCLLYTSPSPRDLP